MSVSIIDIAKLAGVSKSTVSAVINNHPSVRPATRERVLEAIKAQKESGKYQYDKKKESVTFYLSDANAFKRTFPLKDGVMDIALRFGGKTLNAKFKQK